MTKADSSKRGFSGLIVAITTLLLSAWASAAAAAPYALGFGVEFASGKYGTGISSESYYMPLTVAVYPTGRLDFTLEVPYIYRSGSAVLRGPQGQMMPVPTLAGAMAGAGTGGSGMGGSGMGPGRGGGSMNPATPGGSDNSQSGLGDITVKAGYILFPAGEFRPQIRPNIFVKFPTADEDKGLGTGELDGGFALEISHWRGDWHSFAEVGYTIQGKTPALPLKDYLFYSAGLGYQVTDKFRPLLEIKGFTAPTEGTSDLLEARLRLKYQATAHAGLEVYIAQGLTTASPDYGTGLAIFYDY